MTPLPYWDFLNRIYPEGAAPQTPSWAGIFLHAFLMPPDAWSYAPDEKPPYTFRRRWAFDNATGLDACGTVLAQQLGDEAFPRMRWLLDPGNVVAELRKPTFATQRALFSDNAREIMLTVDEASPDHLDQLLAEAGRSPAPDFETWVRERIARRQPSHR